MKPVARERRGFYVTIYFMKKLIIANWKMNPRTAKDAVALAQKVAKGVRPFARKIDVVLAPPFPFLALPVIASANAGGSSLKLGAQDVFWENFQNGGAYTGEVSAAQLRSLGVSYVIVGHSERRALGETNDVVRKKMLAVLKNGMYAILCVGEQERKKETA